MATSSSGSTGFSRYISACGSTAVKASAQYPETTTTGTWLWVLAATKTSRPLSSPSFQSVTMASKVSVSNKAIASGAVEHTVTSCPARSKMARFKPTAPASSSTHKILAKRTPVPCHAAKLFSPPLLPYPTSVDQMQSQRRCNLSVAESGADYFPIVARSVLAESLAVRSSFSQLKERPSMARLMVLSSTREKTCR